MTTDPKFIWVRMLKRPPLMSVPNAYGNSHSAFQLCGKFNSILEECLLDGDADNHCIISIEVEMHDFDLTGNLLSAGKVTFWKEINRGMTKLDNKEITLKPRKQQPNMLTKNFMSSVMKSIGRVERENQHRSHDHKKESCSRERSHTYDSSSIRRCSRSRNCASINHRSRRSRSCSNRAIHRDNSHKS